MLFFLSSSAFTLLQAQTPTASMSFPQFNSSYLAGTEINIQANATTPAGTTVTKVEFFFDAAFSGTYTKIGEDTDAPYSITWTAPTVPANGRSYQIRAVVTNSASVTAIQSGTGYNGINVYPVNYVSTRNWYVNASASATNTAGTEALPLNTIQKAADRVAPGDTVFVMAGTYTGTSINIVGIQRTGLPTRSIVFKPYKTDKPVLQLGNNNWQGFNVLPAAAYIRIEGFEVIGNNATITLAQAQQQPGACEGPNPAATPIARFNGNGISITGNAGGNLRPHHVVIASNTVHDCAGGGIGGGQCDYITFENNTVYNNSWYTVYGTSGLNIINAWNFDNNTATPRIIMRNNRSFGNILKIAWNIGGTGTNCKFYDGNGIILDNNNAAKNTLGSYTGKFLIENNLCYLNGGRGINVNYSDNVTILNNTTYQNGVSDGGPGIGIESEFIAQGSTNISVYNNIFYGRPGEKVTEVNSSTITHNNNLTFEGTGTPFFSGNQNIVGQNPQFVDAASGNFQLNGNSPALNVGSSTGGQFSGQDIVGVSRPQGAGVDIGAFERLAGLPVRLVSFTGNVVDNRSVQLDWTTATERNNNYFLLERSKDLIQFETVTQVKAKEGQSDQLYTYSHTDLSPYLGTSYYRLRQVDLDGTNTTFKAISVVVRSEPYGIFPNPVRDGQFTVNLDEPQSALVNLYSADGRVMPLQKTGNTNSLLHLKTSQKLSTGVYILTVEERAQMRQYRVVID